MNDSKRDDGLVWDLLLLYSLSLWAIFESIVCTSNSYFWIYIVCTSNIAAHGFFDQARNVQTLKGEKIDFSLIFINANFACNFAR